MEPPHYPYLSELDRAVGSSWGHVEMDNCLYCGQEYLSSAGGPTSSCLYKLEDCWYRNWCCKQCAWFISDLGAEKRRAAARVFARDLSLIHDETQFLLSEIAQTTYDENRVQMFAMIRDLKHSCREVYVSIKLYPTLQEYTHKVQRSTYTYLLLHELGFLHDIAWPVVALAYWIL